MEKIKIDRINELAHKSKSEGLTDAEKEEQRLLRMEFLAEIRADLKASLEWKFCGQGDIYEKPRSK